MAINHAKLRNAVLNTERLNIAMNANNTPVRNISTMMNMKSLLRTDGKMQIWKEQKI